MASREIEKAHHSGHNATRAFTALFLESGAIIMIAQLLWLVLFRKDNGGGYNVVAGAITQVYVSRLFLRILLYVDGLILLLGYHSHHLGYPHGHWCFLHF